MTYLNSNYDLLYCFGIQKFLNEHVPSLVKPLFVDGQIGPGTSAVLKQYQAIANLTQTGNYDDATQAVIEPIMEAKYVMLCDVRAEALRIGATVPQLCAFMLTESQGSGFLSNGACAILFERHIFYQMLSKDPSFQTPQIQAYVAQYPNIVNPQPAGYLGGVLEWNRFKIAQMISDHNAKMSISMGLAQIMGENYSYCGYKSVEDYFTDMVVNEKKQATAFANYLQNYLSGRILTAIQAQDWATAAKYYNGPANVADYSARLSANYTKCQSFT